MIGMYGYWEIRHFSKYLRVLTYSHICKHYKINGRNTTNHTFSQHHNLHLRLTICGVAVQVWPCGNSLDLEYYFSSHVPSSFHHHGGGSCLSYAARSSGNNKILVVLKLHRLSAMWIWDMLMSHILLSRAAPPWQANRSILLTLKRKMTIEWLHLTWVCMILREKWSPCPLSRIPVTSAPFCTLL